MNNIWSELKRRHVVRVTLAYAFVAWLLLQVAAILFPAFNAPQWSIRALTIALLCGLPLTILLSWIFDITPDGIVVTKEDTGLISKAFIDAPVKPIKLSKLNLASRKLTPLVGRVQECESIRKHLTEAKAGSGSILLIGGEPGLGKTRLAEEALHIGTELGMLPLVGHAYEEQSAPYIIATEMIEEMSRSLPISSFHNILGTTASEVSRLVPDLKRTFPDIPEPIELPPGQQQRYLFNALLELLTRLTQATPVVMLLDDMHWADESSVQLLEHVAAQVPNAPIVFVVTYRDADIDMGEAFKNALPKLGKLPFVHRIPLNQLSFQEVKTLLMNNGGSEPPAKVVDLVYAETEGNVFFVRSVFQHLKDQGKLFDAQGNWVPELDSETIDVPESIRLVTNQRIDRLSNYAREVLTMAAVMGLRFRLQALETAMQEHSKVLEVVELAEAAELIKPAIGGHELRYEFVHALARQAILSQVSAIRKQQLHLKIAEAIEAVEGRSLENHAVDIAYHLNQAGAYADIHKTVSWLEKAGDHSRSAIAMDQAVTYYHAALERANDDALQAKLLNKRASAYLSKGMVVEFERDMRAALNIYEQLADIDQAAHLCYELSYFFAWHHQPLEAMEIAQTGLEIAGTQASPARCMLLSTMGFALNIAALTDQSEPIIEQAIQIATELESDELLANALFVRANMHWFNMQPDELLLTVKKAIPLFRKLKDEWNLAECLWMQQAGHSLKGEHQQVTKISSTLEPLGVKYGIYGALLCMELFEGVALQQQGDINNAIRQLKRAANYARIGNLPWVMEGHVVMNLLLHGNINEARTDMEYCYENRMHGGSGAGSVICFWLYGKAFLGDEDTLDAFESLQSLLPESGKPICTGTIMFLLLATESLVLCKQHETAADMYKHIVYILNEKKLNLPFSLGLTERFAAIAASAGKNWQVAEQHFANAMQAAKKLPHKTEEPQLLYWHARMLLDRNAPGDSELAQTYLTKARQLCKKLGMLGYLAMIERTIPDSVLSQTISDLE
ncbi:MAG: AAA family ATPase [Gammaproteobacteria bacterium]|nr:AAA family ATPase [Gammaproteobacteria bacterium]NNC97350.1 AAA family ATPase [Gammaproteobacteria bacterium]NNM13131.1 AAA family ATPase [Gammaproteobacteria bacterium]